MESSWFEHVDLMQAILCAVCMIVGWFLVRTLKKIDKNQDDLFTRLHTLETDFYELRGEHKVRHG